MSDDGRLSMRGFSELMRAEQLLATGNVEAARPLIARRLAEDPDDLTGLLMMSAVERTAGRLGDALTMAQRALLIAPDDPDAWICLAYAQAASGSQPEALVSVIRAVGLRPGDWVGHAVHSEIADAGRRIRDDEGLFAAQEAVRLAPFQPDAYSTLGNALSARSRGREATAAFGAALAISPTHSAALNGLSALRMRTAPAVAASQFAQAAADAPYDRVPVHNLRVSLGRIVSFTWIAVFVGAQISTRTATTLMRHPENLDASDIGFARSVFGIVAAAIVLIVGIAVWRTLRSFGSQAAGMLRFALTSDRLLAGVAVVLAAVVLIMLALVVVPPTAWLALAGANFGLWLIGVILTVVRSRRMRRDREAATR